MAAVSDIRITLAGPPHEFGVEVTDGAETTSHHVIVPPSLLEGLSMKDADEEDVVRASFDFLLEREPAGNILPDFSLAIISRYFPEYAAELPARLTQRP